jgi:hypothetical protein
MKQSIYSLLIISFLLVGGNLSAQTDTAGLTPKKVPATQPKNPRVSSKPAYTPPATNSTDTGHKNLKPKESLNMNAPMSGGLLYLGGVLGITQGQFAVNTGNAIGYGFDVGGLMNVSKRRTRKEWEKRWVNAYVGMHFMFLRNSSTSDNYSKSDGQYTTEVDAKVRNNMYQVGPLFRVEVLPGPLKLFAEVGTGFSLFNGVHKVETTSIPIANHQPEDEKTATESYTLRSNLIGYYNYAFGVRISGETIGIEFKFSTLNGGTATYVDTKSVSFNRSNNSVTYSTHQSATNMFIPTIAVSGRF